MVAVASKAVLAIAPERLLGLKNPACIHMLPKFSFDTGHWVFADGILSPEGKTLATTPQSKNPPTPNQSSAKPRFTFGLSFAGEPEWKREFVRGVAERLAVEFTREKILFDDFHKEELAVNGAAKLPDLFRNETEVILVFICDEYADREWPQAEWQAALRVTMRERDRVLLLSWDDTQLPGLVTPENAIRLNQDDTESVVDWAKKRLKRVRQNQKEESESLAAVAQGTQQADPADAIPPVQAITAKEAIQSRQREDMERQLQAVAGQLGENLSATLKDSIRLQNTSTVAELRQKSEEWLDGVGRAAAGQVRLRVLLLLSEAMFSQINDTASPETGDVIEVLDVAEALADDETAEDDAARLLSLRARILYVDGKPEEALDLLADQTSPMCVRFRLIIARELGRDELVNKLLTEEDRSVSWSDIAVEIFCARLQFDEARDVRSWSADQGDEIAHKHCVLALARSLFNHAVSQAGNPANTSQVPDESIALLSEVLDVLDPLLTPGLSSGQSGSGLETRAHEIAVNAGHLLGRPAVASASANILANTEPLSVRLPFCVMNGYLDYSIDLVERLRAEWAGTFEVLVECAGVEGAMSPQPADFLQQLPSLWDLAGTDADRQTRVARLVAHLLPMLDEPERREQLADLEKRVGADHPNYLLGKAKLRIRATKLDDVQQLLNSVSPELLEKPEWKLLRADLAELKGDKADALATMVELVESIPSPDLLLRTAHYASDLKDWGVMAKCLKKVAQIRPDDVEARKHFPLALVHLGTDESFRSAIQEFEWLESKEPKTLDYPYNRALLHSWLSEVPKALEILEPLCQEDQDYRPALLLRSNLLATDGKPVKGFQLLNNEVIRTRYWNDLPFLYAYMDLAYRAKREDAAHDAMMQIQELERDVPEAKRSMRAIDMEDLQSMFDQRSGFLSELHKLVTQSRCPWPLIATEQNRPLLHEWFYRTQPMCVLEHPEARGTFIIYATNGFWILSDPENGSPQLEAITSPANNTSVVLDTTALLTLHELGLLENTLGFFDHVYAPADLVQEYSETTRRLQPTQQSMRDSCQLAIDFIDQGKLTVVPTVPTNLIVNFDQEQAAKAYGIRNVIEWLGNMGGLSKARLEELAAINFQDTKTAYSPSGKRACGVTGNSLKTLAQYGLLDLMLKHGGLEISAGQVQALRSELNAWKHQDSVLESYIDLVERLREDERCSLFGFDAPDPFEDDERSQLEQRIDRCLAGARFAATNEHWFVTDDRVVQRTFLSESSSATPATCSTINIAQALYEAGEIDVARFGEITHKLIQWRYRFHVPRPEVMLEWAIQYRDGLPEHPGQPLVDIAAYAHDCMSDPGLPCGMEPTEPPMSLSSKLYVGWLDCLAHFILGVWCADELNHEQQEALTGWAIWECMPVPPTHASRQEQINLARNPHFLILSKILMHLALQPEDMASAEMMQGLQETFGIDRVEYCRIVAQVAELCRMK